MSFALILVAILGLAVLMIVHEAGHYFAARRFGMRVLKFSIGFGPTIWKHQPKDSPTTFQVAIIPFLAYVQIDGMNPFEPSDPEDKGSFANGSLWGRFVTIAAGSVTNYLFASVLIFAGIGLVGQREIPDFASMRIQVDPEGPAAKADIRNGDKILAVNEASVANWQELTKAISSKAGETIAVKVERGGETLVLSVAPESKGPYVGKIRVGPAVRVEKVTLSEMAKDAIVQPAFIVYETGRRISRMILRKDKVSMDDFGGPVDIVRQTKKQAERGPGSFLHFLGGLSAYLAAFNLLPFPALDGGRLMFFAWEAISRKKPDPKMEATIHFAGIVVLLSLIAVVTFFDIFVKS